jgi:hypothetical protein
VQDFASGWGGVAGQFTVDPHGAGNVGFGSVLAHDPATGLGPVVAQDSGIVDPQGDGNQKLGAVVADDPGTQPGSVLAHDPATGLGPVVAQDPGIVDLQGTGNKGLGGVVAHDPGAKDGNTIVATAPDQTLTGTGARDTFVFNFANIGKDAVTNFHPVADTPQFGGTIFTNEQAAFNATHDDGQGNTIVGLDAHDTTTLTGVLKAQLHVTDFHVV